MLRQRSKQLERIDTGDYTPEEYAIFMREIAFINKYLGDARALRNSLLTEVEKSGLKTFSVLDVACGSGQLLRQIRDFAASTGREAHLIGVDLNELSFTPDADNSAIAFVRTDAFHLPFPDNSFDYAISSLFLHHLTDQQIPAVLNELSRVARRGVFAIDLERRPSAWLLYRIFCFLFRISPLVTQDGSLSVLRGFRRSELGRFGSVRRSFPFRLLLRTPPL